MCNVIVYVSVVKKLMTTSVAGSYAPVSRLIQRLKTWDTIWTWTDFSLHDLDKMAVVMSD